MLNSHISSTFSAYVQRFPQELSRYTVLNQQVVNHEDLLTRKNPTGHATASAFIMSTNRTQILVIHHALLDIWCQPGGHLELDDATLHEAAKREATEETGLLSLQYLPLDPDQPDLPFDVDSHLIPARPEKQEGLHYHHDFRYVFVATNENIVIQAEEIKSFAWISVEKPDRGDESFFSTVKKLTSLGFTQPKI